MTPPMTSSASSSAPAAGDGENDAARTPAPARRRRRATAAQAAPDAAPPAQTPSAQREEDARKSPADEETAVPPADDSEPGERDASAQEPDGEKEPAGRAEPDGEAEDPEDPESPEDTGGEKDPDDSGGEKDPEDTGADGDSQDSESTGNSEDTENGAAPDAGSVEGDEEPRLPASSLLFQAPDPSRARRRRVTAAQTAPDAAPAAEPRGGARSAKSAQSGKRDGSAESVRSAKSAQSDKHDASAEPAQSAESESGGTGTAEETRPARGRRRRKVTAAQAAPEHAPAAPAHHQTPADADSGSTDSGDDGADEGTAEGAPKRRRRARGRRGAGARRTEAAETPDKADGDDKDDDDEAGAARADADAGPADSGQGPAHEEREESAEDSGGRRKRRRGGRGRRSRSRSEAPEDAVEQTAEKEGAKAEPAEQEGAEPAGAEEEASASSRRRRRRRSRARSDSGRDVRDEVTGLKGSTRLEAKRQRRREGRAAGRRRPIITEAEFLARRESVDRQMIVREQDGLNQIALLEDGLLVEHYVARHTQVSMVGNVYVGRVQNVLPSMEAAFVDLGRGRNAVLYAGEVNWDAAGMEGRPRRIEDALSSGDTVLVQVTKDPIGHKGARLTSQITLAGRYLVLVPGGAMTGISRKLPDTERARLKKILKRIIPDDAGVIVRTAAEGASEEQLTADVKRLISQWQTIDKKASSVFKGSSKAPVLLKGEPELAVRVVRDVFNEDFRRLVVQGSGAWKTISQYVDELSPDLADRLEHWVDAEDVFAAHRVDEQLAKGFDRKVWLPSGGTLIIDRTEAMTVIDVNTGRFTGGAGGTLEETVTRNNLEAAEEIVRQLRLRDIGGMVVIDFVDMVLESNRDLVLRRLIECLGRDRTRHQVTEVTSLGLVQMTRKRVGQGLVEAFSTPCECCGGRGFIVHDNPVENQAADMSASGRKGAGRRGRKNREESAASRSSRRSGGPAEARSEASQAEAPERDDAARAAVRGALAQIAAATEQAHSHSPEHAGAGHEGS